MRNPFFLGGIAVLAAAISVFALDRVRLSDAPGLSLEDPAGDPAPAAPTPDGAAVGGAPSPVASLPVPDASPGERVPSSRDEISLSFAPLVKQTAAGVVNVYAARQVRPQRSPFADDPFFGQFFGGNFDRRPRMESSLGSGVIVSSSGLIVTNNHVVEGADEVKIALADGREYPSKILMKDARVDLAILQVEGESGFSAIPLADSDAVEIGDLVLAIGNPFGIGQTVTNGIVSALARTHIGVNDFGFFIQTDAAINPGNSGGALIDMSGRLVGVNTAIFSRSGGSNGIGFAIPSNMVRAFVRAAESGEALRRPFVGASFARVTADVAEALELSRPTGVLMESVVAGGPMAALGLEPGDVVLSMDGITVDGPEALSYRLVTAGVGSTATMVVWRNGERREVELVLAAAPEDPPRDERTMPAGTPFGGVTVANLSPRLTEEMQLRPGLAGVVVTEVAPRSPAARFGLAERDVIRDLNGIAIDTTRTLESALRSGGRGWRYTIERDGRQMTQLVR